MRAPATVVSYDEAWPGMFDVIAARLRTVVPEGVGVQHVGSTSVPGLAAKPIIDVDVVVATPERVPEVIEALATIGYVHTGDLGIKGREAFDAPEGLPYHHLYLLIEGSSPHRDHTDLRDYLRAHLEAAARYGSAKSELAHLLTTDRRAYVEAKDAIVIGLLAEARRT